MATNKTAIQAKVNEIETGVLNPASTVRDVLKDSEDSILESIYGDSVDEFIGDLSITTASGDFTYNFVFQKVGKLILVSGTYTPLSTLPSGTVIATITDTNWIAQDNAYYTSSTTATGDIIRILIEGNEIKVGNSVFSGEKANIDSLTYNALN